jgi:hypothetical protein
MRFSRTASVAFLMFLSTALTVRAVEPAGGSARLKVDLLGVFAHPDDETGVAATVASVMAASSTVESDSGEE